MLRHKCKGASGQSPWRNVANENAWASITVAQESVMGGADVKFQICHGDPNPNPTFRHGLTANPQKIPPKPIEYGFANINDATGTALSADIAAPGFYDLATRIGGVDGRIVWSGGDETTDMDIAVNTQMV